MCVCDPIDDAGVSFPSQTGLGKGHGWSIQDSEGAAPPDSRACGTWSARVCLLVCAVCGSVFILFVLGLRWHFRCQP